MNYYLFNKETRDYAPADVLPPGVKIGRYGDHAFYAVEPYVVHARTFGMKGDKKAPAVVHGVSGESLLIKFQDPDHVYMYDGYNVKGWHTARFDETTEGWRFVRSVVKTMKVLTSLAKKAAVERNKRERNRAAAKAREGREGTCQICEGRQIIQPTGDNKGTLVLHGYTRPGYGYTIGNCYGYHRKPFEVACDALTEWVEMLKAEKARTEASLAEIPHLKSMMVEKSWRNKELIEIFPGDERWTRELNDRKWHLEQKLHQVEREIAHQGGRLEAWHKEHG